MAVESIRLLKQLSLLGQGVEYVHVLGVGDGLQLINLDGDGVH